MKRLGLKTFVSTFCAGLMLVTGCPSDDDAGAGDTEDTEDSASTSGTDSASTSSGSTSGTDSASGTTMDPTTTSTTTSDGSTGDTPEPQPNGVECNMNDECMSGFCYTLPILGGWCGECLTEADCADSTGGGCTPPNPFAMPPTPAACNTGAIGEGCDTSAVCQGDLECIEFLDVGGLLQINTCGECTTDMDCEMNEQCAPQLDAANFSGQNSCVGDGTVTAGQGCDYMGGSEECVDGLTCAAVDIMGLLTFGLCAECAVDADCMGNQNGETCLEASIDEMTFDITPPQCGTPM